MGHKDMAIGHEYGIADLAAFQLVVITPGHLPFFDDEHPALLALSGIEKVVTGEIFIHLLCRYAS